MLKTGLITEPLRSFYNSYSLKEDGLFFSFPIQGSGLSLFSNLSAGEFCPLRIPFDKLGAAGSPTDKLRKDSALTPVTSEKSTLFIGLTKIDRFCKALPLCGADGLIHGDFWFYYLHDISLPTG